MDYASTHRRESIIFTAIDVMNEFGIHAVSTKKIAERQRISESTIFRFFPQKTDLLGAVLDYYSLYDDDLFKTVKLKGMKPRDAILFYVDLNAAYYENYPAITVITQAYDVLRYEAALADKINRIYSNRTKFIQNRLDDAMQAGEIRKDTCSEDLADIVISTIRGICLKWRMEGYGFPLRERLLKNVNMLMDAFCP